MALTADAQQSHGVDVEEGNLPKLVSDTWMIGRNRGLDHFLGILLDLPSHRDADLDVLLAAQRHQFRQRHPDDEPVPSAERPFARFDTAAGAGETNHTKALELAGVSPGLPNQPAVPRNADLAEEHLVVFAVIGIGFAIG